MRKFRAELKIKSKKINIGSSGEYAKDYLKIKFDSDDNLPLNKILNFRILTIIIRFNYYYYYKSFRKRR